MKKIFKILTVIAALTMLTSCFKVYTPLSLNPTSVTIEVGQTASISISADGDAYAITELQSEDTSIAYAKGTTITGVSVGKTKVYAQELDKDGKVVDTAYCDVTVVATQDK